MRARGRVVRGLVAVAVATGAASLLLAAPAGAANLITPPWYHGGPGVWGAITFTPTSPPYAGDGKFGPVTITRHVPVGVDPATIFTPFTDEHGNQFWPASGVAGPFTFTRVGDCAFINVTCHYYLSGKPGTYSNVIFAAGAEPQTPPGQPSYFEQFQEQSVELASPPPPPAPVPPSPQVVGHVTFTPNPGGGPQTATFDATGSTAAPGGYRWTLQRVGTSESQTFTCAAAKCSPPPNINLAPGASYDVTLDLLGATGQPFASSPSAARLTVPAATPGPAPAPAPAPAPGPGPGGGLPPSDGGGVAHAVFAPAVPQRAPTVLARSTGAAAPSIVWLWRPDWFQPPAANDTTQKSGRPSLKGRRDIVVSRPGPDPHGASAGPWLAGLGAFGLIGAGLMFRRRRMLRLEP